MDLGIKGLRVIVTAGAAGIGREVARAFLHEGALVQICDVDRRALAELASSDPELKSSVCDVSDREAVTRFIDAAASALGGLDCLINNAGIAGPTGRVDEISPEEWDRTLAVNITGQFNCVRVALRHLAKSSNPSIINLSSTAGRLGFPLRTPYAASKWAVVGFTKSLAVEQGRSIFASTRSSLALSRAIGFGGSLPQRRRSAVCPCKPFKTKRCRMRRSRN
jgi:NAD(P)-dependent dehydrogenase (short-subunit alcohol dehydrogenase family)